MTSDSSTTASHALLVAIERVGDYRLLMPAVHNREVISPHDPGRHSPFILMVEDRISDIGEYGVHAHRGFITVTIMLAGELEHVESCDGMRVGTLHVGDVHWMTAGRGIRHGGRPVGGTPVHALQLWLNLPAAQKMTPAASDVQRFEEAASLTSDGVAVTLYAGSMQEVIRPYRSPWPLTLIDVHLHAARSTSIPLAVAERAFLYVMAGEVRVGPAWMQTVRSGEVAWFGPEMSHSEIALTAVGDCRLIYGAGKPIDEPLSAGSGFVMNTPAQIEQAYADLNAGVF